MDRVFQAIKRKMKVRAILVALILRAVFQLSTASGIKNAIQFDLFCFFFLFWVFVFEDHYPRLSRWLINFIVGAYPFVCFLIGDTSRFTGISFFFLGSALQFFFGKDMWDFASYTLATVIGSTALAIDMGYYPHHYNGSVFLPIFNDENFRSQFWTSILTSLAISFMLAWNRHDTLEKQKVIERNLDILNTSLKKAMEEKDNFILRFSHEIRNPLSNLLGNIELLAESVTDPGLVEMVTDTKVCGEILLQLLNNILDSAKITERNLEVNLKPSSTSEFFEKLWIVCSEMIRSKKLYGTLYMNENVPDYLMLDCHRITQIIINLITNATKFTEKGFVNIHIDFVEKSLVNEVNMWPVYVSSQYNRESKSEETLAAFSGEYDLRERTSDLFYILSPRKKRFPKQSNGFLQIRSYSQTSLKSISKKRQGYLRIEVNDSGCGMEPSKISRLFSKFTQVHDESIKRQIGTGLGLWITKQLVEILNGDIKVYSGVNEGTCFIVAIKAETCDPILDHSRATLPTQKTEIDALQQTKGLHVLVMEDGPYNQDVKRRFLTRLGFDEIVIVADGLSGLQLFKAKGQSYFDLIISDLDMPVLDGYSACKQIREHEESKGWKRHPIVIVTGHPTPAIKEKVLDPHGEIKALHFFPKPVSFGNLKDVFEELGLQASAKSESGTVLVAEDDPFNIKILRDMLSRCGKKFITVSNGKQAVEEFLKHKEEISLILMDCEMPVMDGMDASKIISEELKKMKNDTKKSVKIIGLTGHLSDTIKTKCIESGMTNVITKPLNFQTLEAICK